MPRASVLRLLALPAVLLLAWLAARSLGVLDYLTPGNLVQVVERARAWPWSAPVFVGAYALASTIGLPASPLTLAGGALFGFGPGSLLNWIGATVGAFGAYLLARQLGGAAVESLLGGRAHHVKTLAGGNAFPAMLRLRLIPIMPFNGLNFGAGLAGVRPGTFVLSTALGIIPGTLVYTYFADALLAGASGARQAAFLRLAIASVLLIALSFTPRLVRRFSRPAGLVLLFVFGPIDSGAQGTAVAVDHSPFTAMLGAHVTNGLVDYDAFHTDVRFAPYLESLRLANPVLMTDADRLAFWINTYNAYTIHLINTRGERRSIRNINKKFGVPVKSPWSERIVQAGGRVLSLDDVEHRVIRREFREPRIHMALVCASLGCPPLRTEAYEGRLLDGQLDDQARRFLGSPELNRIDVASGTVYASPIFTWYRDDFGGSLGGVARFWARYVTSEAERTVLLSGSARWRETKYDWSLNSRPAYGR